MNEGVGDAQVVRRMMGDDRMDGAVERRWAERDRWCSGFLVVGQSAAYRHHVMGISGCLKC